MALYALGSKGLVDESNLAILDARYNDKLLEADNVYLNRVNLLTRRPPIVPKGFEFEPGEILDSKTTKEHYVIVRRVEPESLSTESLIYDHITNGGNTLETRTVQTGTVPDGVPSSLSGSSTGLTSYEYTPNSDLVAIDFYSKKTGRLNLGFSKLFAIHKPDSSLETDGNKATNHLTKVGSNAAVGIDGLFRDRGESPSLIGIYSNYTNISSYADDLKYVPPSFMSPQGKKPDDTGTTIQDATKSPEYITYKEELPYRALRRRHGATTDANFKISNYEFVGIYTDEGNVRNISVYNDSVVFTFCGLGYSIDRSGVLRCIHHPSVLLPTVKEINQDTIRTYPVNRFLSKNVSIPINVFFHRGVDGANDKTDLNDVEQMTGDDFRDRYPDYAPIMDRLSQVVSYVPLQYSDGTYSETDFYVMPDLKILIPETDVSADCKFIAKGRTKGESAWFGVPCMRYAFLDRHGFFTETDNDRFPSGNGISAGGVGLFCCFV